MTIVAMGLGYSITAADPTILSANLAEVRRGLDFTPATASFLASLCTLTLAAAVLGAGALGDLAGMKRMFAVGCWAAAGRLLDRGQRRSQERYYSCETGDDRFTMTL